MTRRSPKTSSRPVMPTWWAARGGFFADPEISREGEGRTRRGHPPLHRPEHLHDDGEASASSIPTTSPSRWRPPWCAPPRGPSTASSSPAAAAAWFSKRLASAAIRGHRVGAVRGGRPTRQGAVRLMQAMPGREHVRSAVDWWARQLDDLGVKVHLRHAGRDRRDRRRVAGRGDRRHRSDLRPHRVNGLRQAAIRSRASTADFVHTPEAVLGGDFAVDGTVIVLDEETTSPGHGVAEVLAQHERARVELVTRQLAVGLALAGGWQHSHVMRRLHELGITARPNTYVARHRRSHRHPVRREHGRGVDRSRRRGRRAGDRALRPATSWPPPSLPVSTTCV